MFGTFLAIRRWHAEFLKGDFPVVIFIQFAEGIRRGLDFIGGDYLVLVGIKDCEQGWDRRRPPFPAVRLGRLGGGGDARGQGEQPLES